MNDETLQHTTFDGVADYIAALDTVCSSAQHSLNIFEKDFSDIGFNSEARYDALRHYLLLSTNNRLQILAHDPQHLVRFCPRMMMLLREFSHSMAIYQTPAHMHGVTEPFAVADNHHYVRRFHFDDTRGLLAKNDPEGARELNSRFHEMWASSHSGATPTRLGL
ncbi:MAG: hypothetical protein KJ850_11295 [Gammaproteobacteria bacterium]|nr:hypothetical protein [Gammaproteobacteria bacterium]MBU1625614.1 hypothetical protein [Gammaproteobacteria bacterium]MBU1980874.1 hypothetical protein [Gammaproteobacteria bacterium]